MNGTNRTRIGTAYPRGVHPTRYFGNLLIHDKDRCENVLEIGAGRGLNEELSFVRPYFRNLIGVDPSPEVLNNNFLSQAIVGNFEDAAIPAASIDLAYSYNVVEHIPNAASFIDEVARVLKPGGLFHAFTPHALHPFSVLSRLSDVLSLKDSYKMLMKTTKSEDYSINDYPAYYRLNCRSALATQLKRKDQLFASATIHYIDSTFDHYLPNGLRWTARAYNRLVSNRIPSLRLLLVYTLEKSATQ